jgi:hypothetical protein
MEHPEIKDAFGPFKKLSKDSDRFDRELRLHGVRVLRTIETVLDSRYDSVRLARLLHNLGKKHVIYQANSDYFEVSQLFNTGLSMINRLLVDRWQALHGRHRIGRRREVDRGDGRGVDAPLQICRLRHAGSYDVAAALARR